MGAPSTDFLHVAITGVAHAPQGMARVGAGAAVRLRPAIGLRAPDRKNPSAATFVAGTRQGNHMNKFGTRYLLFAMAVALVSCSSAWAQAPCVVTDPVGDFLGFAGGTINSNPCQGPGSGCEPWLDIVNASVLKQSGVFHLSVTVAEAVPSAPPLRPGAKRDIWAWNFDTDPATSPKGFPFDPATVAPPEFIVRVIWDGASFSAVVIDRRPLLTGGQATVVPVSFNVSGTQVSADVDQSLLGGVSSLVYRAATQSYTAGDGTDGFLAEDRTSQAQCSW